MDFEWDTEKAARNCRKHGVSFHEAATVFSDPFSTTYHDPDHSATEDRSITVGMSWSGRVIIVAHTDRGDNVRIISARTTTPRERRHYEQGQ